MSFSQTAGLGALAGFTIFLSLPVGRLQLLSERAKVCLAMFSVGILAFLFVDVLSHGEEILEESVKALSEHGSHTLGSVVGKGLLLAVGFTLGTFGLGVLERWMRARQARTPMAGGSAETVAVESLNELERSESLARQRALHTGLIIAAAIGLHNFAEGLAIGVAAQSGEISLATVLIIGFALHNATEGFGIVGPLGNVRPSWRWLGLVGLVGGGPTFLGSMIGYHVTSEPLQLAFYALAGGAIFYVIGEIWHGMRRYGSREIGLLMLSLGFVAAVATDMVVAYGGG